MFLAVSFANYGKALDLRYYLRASFRSSFLSRGCLFHEITTFFVSATQKGRLKCFQLQPLNAHGREEERVVAIPQSLLSSNVKEVLSWNLTFSVAVRLSSRHLL